MRYRIAEGGLRHHILRIADAVLTGHGRDGGLVTSETDDIGVKVARVFLQSVGGIALRIQGDEQRLYALEFARIQGGKAGIDACK